MDALTHLFLPITVIYVLFPDRFTKPHTFLLGIFGLLPDADKLLGLQGTFHSIAVVAVAGGLLVAVERSVREESAYAPIAGALLASHLLLDFLDGGPVFLLAPAVSTGFGVTFPTTISLGASPTSVGVARPLPEIRTGQPSQGAATYPLITGYGVLSVLVFVMIVIGRRFNGHS